MRCITLQRSAFEEDYTMKENAADIGETSKPIDRPARKLPKFPLRYRHLIFGVMQSGLTCAVAAAIASLPFYAEGSFASHWSHTYLYSWTIMLPMVVIAAPVIRRIVDAITH